MSDNTKIKSGTPVSDNWNRSVKRIGVPALILAMVSSFLPFLYLYIFHGVMPALKDLVAAWGGIAAIYVAFYIIEPISYYPSLGMSGSYMTWLAGSSSSMRVPSAVVAKDIAGVEDGTQEAEIISTAAVAGSIVTSTIFVALAALVGAQVLAVLPDGVKSAMSSYITPAIFGAVFAMFSGSRPKLAIPTFAVVLCLNYLIKMKILPIPSWGILIISVFGCMIFARIMYKRGKLN